MWHLVLCHGRDYVELSSGNTAKVCHWISASVPNQVDQHKDRQAKRGAVASCQGLAPWRKQGANRGCSKATSPMTILFSGNHMVTRTEHGLVLCQMSALTPAQSLWLFTIHFNTLLPWALAPEAQASITSIPGSVIWGSSPNPDWGNS